jgi:Domain of Unknown Function (DUF1521)
MTMNLTTQTTTTTLSISGNCGCPTAPKEPTTTRGADGNVNFENENYKVGVNDTGEINVTNKQTGETYRVWGDPHMDIDGKHAFDFWGTTTLNLDDGTKITIDTTPWKGGNNGATIASKVTITDGQSDYGVQITGVDDNKTGDLKFNETSKGWLLDAMVDDGNVFHENPAGKGFVAVDDCGNIQSVDQNWVNKTDETKTGKSGNEDVDGKLKDLVDQFSKLVSMFSGIIAIQVMGMFMSSMESGGRSSEGNGRAPSRRDDDMSFSFSETTTSVSWSDEDVSMNFERNSFDFTFSRDAAFA